MIVAEFLRVTERRDRTEDMRRLLAWLPLLGLVGCLMPTGFGTGVANDDNGTSGPIITAATGKNASLPTRADEFLTFLKERQYSAYPHDEALHVGSGPHGVAGVRRFYQPKLAASLQQQSLEHPVGAGAVLELFAANGTTRLGWAASVKLDSLSDGGSNWLWLEALDGAEATLVEAGEGLGLCTNCHASGDDYVLGTAL